jgi:hypothetical protein
VQFGLRRLAKRIPPPLQAQPPAPLAASDLCPTCGSPRKASPTESPVRQAAGRAAPRLVAPLSQPSMRSSHGSAMASSSGSSLTAPDEAVPPYASMADSGSAWANAPAQPTCGGAAERTLRSTHGHAGNPAMAWASARPTTAPLQRQRSGSSMQVCSSHNSLGRHWPECMHVRIHRQSASHGASLASVHPAGPTVTVSAQIHTVHVACFLPCR